MNCTRNTSIKFEKYTTHNTSNRDTVNKAVNNINIFLIVW